MPTTLVLRGADAGGCARAFTIPELGIGEIVKKNGDRRIALGARKRPGASWLRRRKSTTALRIEGMHC
ncbi:hypothetical protein [Streptomyces yangpuensis]|uniref:hypothetical protein n=1 Tax=Streptomyces yangpuensis TaxID=1648182 RepID=UPI00364BB246